jgi:hypothetical protein
MLRRHGVALSLAFLIGGVAAAKEAPGLKVGTVAPELKGKTWFTKDGKAPDLKGKAYLIDFWFGR